MIRGYVLGQKADDKVIKAAKVEGAANRAEALKLKAKIGSMKPINSTTISSATKYMMMGNITDFVEIEELAKRMRKDGESMVNEVVLKKLIDEYKKDDAASPAARMSAVRALAAKLAADEATAAQADPGAEADQGAEAVSPAEIVAAPEAAGGKRKRHTRRNKKYNKKSKKHHKKRSYKKHHKKHHKKTHKKH